MEASKQVPFYCLVICRKTMEEKHTTSSLNPEIKKRALFQRGRYLKGGDAWEISYKNVSTEVYF